MIHPLAWVGWLVATLVALSVTRNPLYLVLLLLCITIVYGMIDSTRDTPVNLVSPLRFAMVVIPLSALFNAATVHFGDTVLFNLPKRLPIIGGPITLEALVFGLINGLVLTGIVLAFTTLSRALPIRALLRLIPRAFFPVAVVVSLGVTFVPVTMRHYQRIREAQALRGHRVRGLLDWLPLLMPLLIGGLERALQMAEAMTARGFASAEQQDQGTMSRVAIVVGLVALLSGWLLRLVWGQAGGGLALMLSGIGLILGVLWFLGRRVPRTTYRPETWAGRDFAVLAGAAVVLGAFVLPVTDRSILVYYPYPALSLPGFDPMIGVAILGLLIPAFFLRGTQHVQNAAEESGP